MAATAMTAGVVGAAWSKACPCEEGAAGSRQNEPSQKSTPITRPKNSQP
jgi:hypothetical protein